MKTATLLCIGLLATTSAALAQQRLQPGLWEHRMTVNNEKLNQAMAQMQQQMASMPPEQRKQMEAMMARQGVSVGGPGQGMTARFCITPEQAARDEVPARDAKCKHTRSERSGNTLRFAFTCEDGSNGEGEYTLQSPQAHSGRMTVNTVRNGKTERVEMQQSGRWLAADCGSIKPLPQAGK